MHGLGFRATGTEWWIGCDRPALLPEMQALVHAAELKLSRFRPASSLSVLNRERSAACPLLAQVVRLALSMQDMTGGAFDATLGARLRALGYEHSFETLGQNAARVFGPYVRDPLRVHVSGETVCLQGEGELDLGGVAKGFIVDRVLDRLVEAGCKEALVDGGGDMRALGGAWPIALESGHVVSLSDGAIATSSVRKRRWRDASGSERHHVLDPRTGDPARARVEVATVRAKLAAIADALATALLVDPEYVCSVLPRFQAKAALCDTDGVWWTTSDWEISL